MKYLKVICLVIILESIFAYQANVRNKISEIAPSVPARVVVDPKLNWMEVTDISVDFDDLYETGEQGPTNPSYGLFE